MPELSTRRREILDAGVVVLAAHGLKGLTHRGIDREAGLPEGSSSAYFRSRSALQLALAEYVAGRLADEVEALAGQLVECGHDHDRAVELTGELFRRWLDRPELLTARLELTLAATRDPDLAARMADWRTRLVAVVTGILRNIGTEEPEAVAATTIAALDGVLLAALQRPAPRRAEFLTSSLALLLGSLADPLRG